MIEPEPEVSVPILLRKLRVKKNLTQGDIAKVLGISYQAYQRLERPGKSNPTLKTLERLAKVFGNTPDFWLNTQRRNDIWAALHTPKRKAKIDRARPIRQVAA